MMKIRTELLEHLMRQCVNEVLDQIDERVQKDGATGPKKLKVKFGKPTEFEKKPVVKEQDEEKDPKDNPIEPSPADPNAQQPSPTAQPEEPSAPEAPEEPSAQQSDDQSEPPPPSVKGAVLVNPKDKSRLQPIQFKGMDDAHIERTLHQLAASVAGNRTKVSIGAKRMAREAAKNPSTSVYFYLGKMDPESDEIFLMADKSLQIAKDDSIQPGEITGAPVTQLPPDKLNPHAMTDDQFVSYGRNKGYKTPVYGIDENTKSLIKTMVNQILDGKR